MVKRTTRLSIFRFVVQKPKMAVREVMLLNMSRKQTSFKKRAVSLFLIREKCPKFYMIKESSRDQGLCINS